MEMSLPTLLLLISGLLPLTAGTSSAEVWELVDVASIVCTASTPAAPGFTTISIENPQTQGIPHVLSFYRTTPNGLTLGFEMKDAQQRTILAPMTVTIDAIARRLGEDSNETRELEDEDDEEDVFASGDAIEEDLLATDDGEDETLFEDGSVFEDASGPTAAARKLSARRRGGGGGGSRSRSGGSTSSRSRTTSSRSRSTPVASPRRRRASPAAARRRGTNTNPPATGVGGSKYTNANGQSYGYTNQNKLNQNMGSGYQTTNYGYAGSNSYRPSMGRNIMMGAGVGLLAGMGTYYMFSRFNSYDRCRSGSYSGNCQGCYERYGDQCSVDPPDENAHRIELMNTGFWPEDFTAPFALKITQVANNAEYAAAVVCPPNTANMSSWTGTAADLFFTLTAVAELAESEVADENEDGGGGGGIFGLLVLICCFCGCCAAVGFCVSLAMKRQNNEGVQSQEFQGQGAAPYASAYGQPQGVVMGQAVPMQPYGEAQPYGAQPVYGQGQPMMAQPVYGQGQPVMAQAVVVQPSPMVGGYKPGQAVATE